MIHIKTPVRVTLYGNIADKANELAFEARGPNFANLSAEAVLAINGHDKLIVQRDALVAACESVLESMDIATEGFGDSIANGMFKGAFLGVRKQTETALALAKGEQ